MCSNLRFPHFEKAILKICHYKIPRKEILRTYITQSRGAPGTYIKTPAYNFNIQLPFLVHTYKKCLKPSAFFSCRRRWPCYWNTCDGCLDDVCSLRQTVFIQS